MPSTHPGQGGLAWLSYALLTVAAWGVYGIFLKNGQLLMKDPVMGRYKAFLFVGIAYFLTAVLAPLVFLWLKGSTWSFTAGGSIWSLVAGIVGAIGAFCVLLAFGAKGTPSVVMTIVFAGAPVVNAVVALLLEPPEGGLAAIRWPFYLGMALAISGAALVTLYSPAHAPARIRAAAPSAASDSRHVVSVGESGGSRRVDFSPPV
jgi:drug/metabolite transporter (DMT)-like permease